MKQRLALIILGILLPWCPTARAETESISQYLINTPVDWLSFGTSQLERRLANLYPKFVGVDYVEEDDVLRIIVGHNSDGFTTRLEAESGCEKTIIEVKALLSIDAKGESIFSSQKGLMGGAGSLAGLFGVPMKGAPKDLGLRLEKITKIQTHTFYSEGEGPLKSVYCWSKLLEAKINYTLS